MENYFAATLFAATPTFCGDMNYFSRKNTPLFLDLLRRTFSGVIMLYFVATRIFYNYKIYKEIIKNGKLFCGIIICGDIDFLRRHELF